MRPLPTPGGSHRLKPPAHQRVLTTRPWGFTRWAGLMAMDPQSPRAGPPPATNTDPPPPSPNALGAGDPAVLPDLVQRDALVGVQGQHARQEVHRVGGHPAGGLVHTRQDLLRQLLQGAEGVGEGAGVGL